MTLDELARSECPADYIREHCTRECEGCNESIQAMIEEYKKEIRIDTFNQLVEMCMKQEYNCGTYVLYDEDFDDMAEELKIKPLDNDVYKNLLVHFKWGYDEETNKSFRLLSSDEIDRHFVPKTPINRYTCEFLGTSNVMHPLCPTCQSLHVLPKWSSFCPNCGQRINWEDYEVEE